MNTGRGFGSVGPMARYDELWVTLVMIAGRLEVVAVSVVFRCVW